MRNFEGSPIDFAEMVKSPAEKRAAIKRYVQEYLGLENEAADAVELIGPESFPELYRKQFEFLNDERLKKIQLGIVPTESWHKGKQPSESHADRGLVLFSEDYFQGEDKSAWLAHELSHCAKFEDEKGSEGYQRASETPAFEDLAGEVPYPNNQVEQYAFSRQFEYLKQQGVEREEIRRMLEEHYEEVDMPFFERLLERAYV
ncbi:MAG: hypothetical protein V1738_00180 [Patescibacteria group bacterium]